jgi:hypothetical protein
MGEMGNKWDRHHRFGIHISLSEDERKWDFGQE